MQSKLYPKALCRYAGDRGILVEYGDGIAPEINHKVRSMAKALKQSHLFGAIEVIPTYRSLLIVYDPSETDPVTIEGVLQDVETRLSEIEISPPKTVEIPVCYGGEFGPDIQHVAREHNLTEADVVRIHTEADYLIYMIGFTPGFPFLGGLPEILHTPRLSTPRTHVPEGSVGIANAQTGIYPIASPGGWQLIGRTPLKLFAPLRENPFLYQTGDIIRFRSISNDEYDHMLSKE